jgi:hypothetical protein
VAGRPIFDAITEKRDVMRASVELWNVARRFTSNDSEDEAFGADEGRYSFVDSVVEISTMRILLCA